ncbi:MAG: hypothetical protein KDD85_06850 [Parvularculaceae bacterium]|nr:hypothetical protein [Parvularculaceae bacterium]
MTALKADYLIIGAGAVSLAFVDAMFSESDATFLIVDRHHLPGGHWNDAYPFVRLHQPSTSYGVASRPLGADRIDTAGSNKGFYELASGAEVLAYFEQLMREQFLPSGRVQYFPMCDYLGNGCFRSLLSDQTHEVEVGRKTVDGTLFNTSVPATHTRKYSVDDSITCLTPNELPRAAAGFRSFTIVGAGKTAMDVGVWLLDNGADPDSISWIVPRDSWLINRATTQSGPEFFNWRVKSFLAQLDASASSNSADELFEKLEAAKVMLRIDPNVAPAMFHYATISEGEVRQLQKIRSVLRNGRIQRVDPDCVTFANGDTAPAKPGTAYVDCTARAVEFGADPRPVFDRNRISIQSLYSPLVTLSASVTGYVEARYTDDETRNRLCAPNVLADTPAEWMRSFLGNLMRQKMWMDEPVLNDWLSANRLCPFGKKADRAALGAPSMKPVARRIAETAPAAAMNLQKLIMSGGAV